MATLPLIPRGPVPDPQAFEAFSCHVPAAGPATPDRLPPVILVTRDMDVSLDIPLPNGNKERMWVFVDPAGPSTFPSTLMRVREGQVVHTLTKVKKNTHTIHLHGIEPSTFNDGVGHTSFEISGEYTYQWQASQAGTYIYHCHKNTVLHFEMGMYGFLIVDPPQGPGFVRRVNAIIPYDVEALWAADDIYTLWHTFNHDAGIACPNGVNAGLNDFNPEFFCISGVFPPNTLTDPRVAVTAGVGQTILIRLTNASYTVLRTTLGLPGEVIEIDGRPLGQAPRAAYSRPFTIPANTPFDLTTAQRWCILVRPTAAGVFPVRMQFLRWSNRQQLGMVDTVIRVV